jgi:geranylgeranyl diphosphate synthase type II
MIHTYSLVHDDLPAMDDDDFRRGRPTSHRAFGEGLAILAGDALLTEAFDLMARARGVPPARVLAAIAEVAAAAGEAGMVGGQALDLAAAGRGATLARVRHIHRLKTGALIRAAVRAGAIVAGAPPRTVARLGRYAEHLGLAFQIADDFSTPPADRRPTAAPTARWGRPRTRQCWEGRGRARPPFASATPRASR